MTTKDNTLHKQLKCWITAVLFQFVFLFFSLFLLLRSVCAYSSFEREKKKVASRHTVIFQRVYNTIIIRNQMNWSWAIWPNYLRVLRYLFLFGCTSPHLGFFSTIFFVISFKSLEPCQLIALAIPSSMAYWFRSHSFDTKNVWTPRRKIYSNFLLNLQNLHSKLNLVTKLNLDAKNLIKFDIWIRIKKKKEKENKNHWKHFQLQIELKF